jgi:hypothetical protein
MPTKTETPTRSQLLPVVDFCGLRVSRLVLGANPFAGYSHQNPQRDRDMIAYHSVDRIIETWRRAQAAGITTFVANNHTKHVNDALRQYLADDPDPMQWIAQVSPIDDDMFKAIDIVADDGCSALFLHGGIVDSAFEGRREADVRAWLDHARQHGIPAGVAAHAPEAHDWVYDMDAADFHKVCFFNCGSLHDGKGEKFRLSDMDRAVERIQRFNKPCIGYKIMAAGRLDARMAFEYAFEKLKPGDVVNVGMHRGDNDDMVEQNVAMVTDILSSS